MTRTVLCVDDEESMLAAYRRFLSPRYRVETAPSAAAGLAALAEKGPFAVVVSDLHMPDMDGVQFLGAARERFPDAVRVLVTGQANLEYAALAVNNGHVFQFLTKPFSPRDLLAAVAAAAGEYGKTAGARERAESALRASEERYQQLFDANPHPLWVYDVESLSFLEVNDAAVQHYGYSRAAFLGMTVRAIEPDAPARAPDATSTRTVRHRLASGEVRQAEITSRPTEFGGRSAALICAVDVTERKRLEEQLKQAQKLESVGHLAAGIAHEINTPVQYIGDNTTFLAGAFRDLGGVLTLYRRAGGDPGLRAAADRAADGADLDYLLDETPRSIEQTLDGVRHVARIVKAMKEFAHPGTEEKAPVDLNHAVETVVAVARNEWKYVAEVVTDLAPDLPPVPGLAGELNQVLLNLLINAAHAVQAGRPGDGPKGTITITTRARGAWAEVAVADTGCGIPDAARARVYDPFFTTKEVGKGTGQGLALAHAVIVQGHAGTISFESEVGAGTTFTVRLPAAADPVRRSQPVRAAAAPRGLPAAPAGGGAA
ncbi:MAG TPA: ATP-binding protein [Urbifossiella sp.]|jgi:PAS domain S-box-containing protein|nr:ATP-binding protein [Urbifossiella sp.]